MEEPILGSHAQGRASIGPYVGPDRASPYPVSRLSGAVSLVDSAREIERADLWIASTSNAKLEQIAAQMKALRLQAEQVLRDAQVNAELHRAEARFQRHAGKTYHLYERAPGQRYWSMLSPSDWGRAAPHGYLGSYRLEADQSWTALERIAERDQARAAWVAHAPEGALRLFARSPEGALEPTIAEKEPTCDSSSSLPSAPIDPASSGS